MDSRAHVSPHVLGFFAVVRLHDIVGALSFLRGRCQADECRHKLVSEMEEAEVEDGGAIIDVKIDTFVPDNKLTEAEFKSYLRSRGGRLSGRKSKLLER